MGVRKRKQLQRLRGSKKDDDNDEVSEKKYDEFTASLRSLDGKKKLQPPTRAEPSFQVSEFHLTKRSDNASQHSRETVNVQDLAQLLAKKPHLAPVHNQFRQTQRKSKKLPKPLEQSVEKKLKRKVGYGRLRKDLDKWGEIVDSNRAADQLSFPLKKQELEVYDDCDILSTFSNPTPLEVAMAEVMKQSDIVKRENQKAKEKQKKYDLTLKEMIERRKMIAKVRAQQSHLAIKSKYQKKIKSKKYHRLLRKDKIKQQMKDFEDLKKTDPDAALEQMNQIERVRAEERATLRHRNTGRWAKNLAVRAKFDKESRLALAEQISQSRALTQKIQANSSDESDDEEPVVEDNESNPWVKKKAENEVDEFFSGYRKFWTDKNKEVSEVDVNKTSEPPNPSDSLIDEVTLSESDEGNKSSPQKKKKKNKGSDTKTNTWSVIPVVNKNIESETCDKKSGIEKTSESSKESRQAAKAFKANKNDFKEPLSVSNSSKSKGSSAALSIDPNNIIKVQPKNLKSGFAKNFSAGDIMDDDEEAEFTEDPHLTIAEAFADDDVVNEFRQEKEDETNKTNITIEEPGLPGWGHWAGHDIRTESNPRKRRRRIMKLPKPPPRLDHNKGRAIIFEEESQSVLSHQVDAIPFPFKSVADYESSVRVPVGKTWVPTTANRKLTAPPVVTKLGTVIEPMDSSELLKTEGLKLNK